MKKLLVSTATLCCALTLVVAACSDLSGDSDTEVVASPDSTTTTTVAPTTTTTVIPTDPPNNWDKHTPANEPSPREGHSMVYDPNSQAILLFGGFRTDHPRLAIGLEYFLDTKQIYDDLWAYDVSANTWTLIEPTGPRPSARTHHAMVHDPDTGKILVCGGRALMEGAMWGETIGLTDMWAYDPSTNTWTELSPVPVGGTLEGVYDPTIGKVVFCDGVTPHSYDGAADTWNKLGSTGVLPLNTGQSPVYDPNLGKIVFFETHEEQGQPADHGAYDIGETAAGALYTYDSQAGLWTKLGWRDRVIMGRHHAAMVYHPGSQMILLFGGVNYTKPFQYGPRWPVSLMAYDSVNSTWTNLGYADRTPYGRTGHAMVYDWKTGKIVMFGGRDKEHGYHSGTWTLSP